MLQEQSGYYTPTWLANIFGGAISETTTWPTPAGCRDDAIVDICTQVRTAQGQAFRSFRMAYMVLNDPNDLNATWF
jgi:hypothetical protein